jgi:hypothetical protein
VLVFALVESAWAANWLSSQLVWSRANGGIVDGNFMCSGKPELRFNLLGQIFRVSRNAGESAQCLTCKAGQSKENEHLTPASRL